MFSEQFADSHDASVLATAIIDTVRSASSCSTKRCASLLQAARSIIPLRSIPGGIQGKLFYEPGDGEWNTPKLRTLLGKNLPEHGVMEGCEVEHKFPDIGRRTMLLNARRVDYEEGSRANILLASNR
jgi:chemotaxis protein methyltransferase CheR